MKKLVWMTAIAGAMFAGVDAHALTFTYATVDNPNDNLFGIEAHAINNGGTIVGNLQEGMNGTAQHGFIYNNGTFTLLNHPAAPDRLIELWGVNDTNQIVGSYLTTTGIYQGFIYANGAFTPVANPLGMRGTVPRGINNAGTIVGQYYEANGLARSFSFAAGVFTPVDHPLAVANGTLVTGISNTGTVVGDYKDATRTHGFTLVGGIYTTIDHPSADQNGTHIFGINASGAVSGFYNDAAGLHGFIYLGGVFSAVDNPQATAGTVSAGINDNGVSTGYFFVNNFVLGLTSTPDRVAARAGTFLNSLGVNTHLSFAGYENVDAVISSLRYLGLRNLRDSPVNSSLQVWTNVAQGAGVKFDAYVPTTDRDGMKRALDLMTPLARAGLLNYIEGGNEEDNPVPISQGNSLAYTAQFQTWVFQTGHALKLPVINMSFGQGWTADNNWRGNYDRVGDLSAVADFGNAHTFPEPGIGQPAATFDALIRDAHFAAPRRPVIHTEVGWDGRTPEGDAAGYVLQGIFDAVLAGSPQTYLYALFNEPARTFGLMNTDGTPKPEGRAVHNLTTLLADTAVNAATFTPGTLPYTVTSATGGDRTLLLQKSDGTYWLALWNEANTAHNVTITLATPAAKMQAYDPLGMTTAVQTVNNASAITLNLAGPPLLIAVTPTNGDTTTTPPNTVVSSANNSIITGDDGTTAITVYGTGNTINGGSGTYTVQALKGNNTINAGEGSANISISGSGNKVTTGSGSTAIRDSGFNNTFIFAGVGAGNTDIYGYIFNQGDTLDFRPTLSGTAWNGDASTVGNFLKLTTVGANTVVTVNPSGLAAGATYPITTLHGYTNMSLSTLLAHAAI